jgi:hypothetical protein
MQGENAMNDDAMNDNDERTHGSGIRNAGHGQASDRQKLPKEQRGNAAPAPGGPGSAEEDTQEQDADDEKRTRSRLDRDPAEGPARR